MAGKFVTPAPSTPAVPAGISSARAASPTTPEGQLSVLLDNFKTALSGRTISVASQKNSGICLLKIGTLFLKNVNDDTFSVLWNFFKENKDGVCREDKALVGIGQIADVKLAKKILTLYNALRVFTMGYKLPMSETEFTSVIPDHVLYGMLARAR